ncbi:MAG: hypothetical protein DI553_10655 [Cutibacterium acnes]|nr:MAG: hypothetical protein DI553_10655 [Cutibacterium acnes]
MIEPTTISTTPRVAIISPSGPARFWGEPPSIALRRHGRSPMRSLPSGVSRLPYPARSEIGIAEPRECG